MTERIKNRLWPLSVLIHVIAVIVMLTIIDACFRSTLTNVKTIGLKSGSHTQLSHIESDVRVLKSDVSQATGELTALARLTYPSLPELKGTASKHRLRLRRTEQINRPNHTGEGQQWYQVTFHGSIGGMVRFLVDLEESFLCQAEAIDIQPADESGTALALSMTINTAVR